MSYVQFDESNQLGGVLGVSRKPGMIEWMQKRGLIKSDKVGYFILAAVIVISSGTAGFLYIGQNTENGGQLTEVEIEKLPEEVRDFIRQSQENEK